MKLLTRLFALVSLTLAPIVGIEVYDEIDARALRAAEGKDQALRLVRLIGNEQSKMIEGARQLLTALGKTNIVRDRDVAACSAFFAELAGSYPQYSSLVSIDVTGHQVCIGGIADVPAYLGDLPSFRLAIKTRDLAIGEYDLTNAAHPKAVYLAQPYYDSTGTVSGVVAAGLSLDWLNDQVARSPLPPKATISVIDRQGTILARYPGRDKFVGTKIPGQAHSYLLRGGEGVQEALGFDGVSRIYAFTALPGGPAGLTLSVGLDKSELLKNSEAANRRDIMVIGGSFVLASLLAGFGARVFIRRPIQTLLDTAEHWKQGALGVRVPLMDVNSEFGRLGASFNSMAAAIGVREQELESRVKERTHALKGAMEAQQTAEAALYKSRKMETVGRLTGGVAHDFNNLLAAIVGNIELARSRLSPGHPASSRLDAAMQSASRGASLVQQLLAFARRQNLRPAAVDLNQYIRGSQDMLQRLLRSDVTVETKFSPEAWLVRVDPNQLEAAILNLAVNARDAMPNGGILRLETRNEHLAGHAGRVALTGDFVALTVSDTGTGIPPDILEKVFEPFFTTKEIGAGSGLGLSMVQGFVRQSSGSVAIESKVGRGTSVTLYLPRAVEADKAINATAEENVVGEGSVLLVDDDPEVRSVTAQLLMLNGYSVLTAANATDALAHFQQADNRIDILVTDLVLTGDMNGIELAAAVHSKRPGLPVVLITGYSELLLNRVWNDRIPVLTKPFAATALARAVQQAMALSKQDLGDGPLIRSSFVSL